MRIVKESLGESAIAQELTPQQNFDIATVSIILARSVSYHLTES